MLPQQGLRSTHQTSQQLEQSQALMKLPGKPHCRMLKLPPPPPPPRLRMT